MGAHIAGLVGNREAKRLKRLVLLPILALGQHVVCAYVAELACSSARTLVA